MSDSGNSFMTTEQFFRHWLGHRDLTRRLIEAFPEDHFFEFSIGGMRSAADLVHELLQGALFVVHEVTGAPKSEYASANAYTSKAEVLAAWDANLDQLQTAFQKLSPEQLDSELILFGSFKGTGRSHLVYFLDNEIHHRGQLYVYLRALGTEPPAFYDRDMLS